MSENHDVPDVEYVPDHVVDGVEYVPVCERCWKPVEQYDEQDEHGQWRHGGFRHVG